MDPILDFVPMAKKGRFMLRLSLVLMILLGSPARAGVSFYDGNKLLTICNDTEGVLNLGICLGYVEAVSDVLDSGAAISGWKACSPENVTAGQVKDIVTRFLVNHPEKRHYAAHTLVARALSEAFPCP